LTAAVNHSKAVSGGVILRGAAPVCPFLQSRSLTAAKTPGFTRFQAAAPISKEKCLLILKPGG
jgi:hypothetical protein